MAYIDTEKLLRVFTDASNAWDVRRKHLRLASELRNREAFCSNHATNKAGDLDRRSVKCCNREAETHETEAAHILEGYQPIWDLQREVIVPDAGDRREASAA